MSRLGAAVRVVLGLLAVAPAVTAQYRSPCADASLVVNFTVTRSGPSGNRPQVTFDRSACTVTARPCTVGSCSGNVPSVTIDVYLSQSFDFIAGSFTEVGNTGSNAADDCNPNDGTTQATQWGTAQSGHGGISVFGTPDRVIYGGCVPGLNFQTYRYTIRPQAVPQTNQLRFESHQSVGTEIVVFQLAGIRVLTSTAAPTVAPTIAPEVRALQSTVSQLQSAQAAMGSRQASVAAVASQGLSMAAAQLTVVQTQSAAVVAQSSTVQALSSTLATQISTAQAGVSQLSASQSSLTSTIAAAVAGLPLAASGGTPAGTPAIIADDNGIRIQGNGRTISLEGQCGAVDPCDVLRALNALRLQ